LKRISNLKTLIFQSHIMKIIRDFKQYLFYMFLKITNKTIRSQLKNHTEIPIIIISFNQLENLKNLIDFFLQRNFSNIVIIDNCSTYEPLLEYFDNIKNKVTIERLNSNNGYKAFFKSPELLNKYAQGYYFLTDPDILPNRNLPADFTAKFIKELERNFNKITKVGFALNLKNIPKTYPQKDKVMKWEQKYWENQIKKDIYLADVDTTFALYKPQYPLHFRNVDYYKAIRFAGDYTCEHMGWFIDPDHYTEEQRFYFESAGHSASWKLDEKGNLSGYKKDY